MGAGLVGSLVEALRHANRASEKGPGAAQPDDVRRAEASAWGYLAHPALMPTVFVPRDDDAGEASGEEVTARKV